MSLWPILDTKPTDEFMNRISALCVIGISKFRKLKEGEKEKVSEAIGTAGGTITGIGGALGAVSAMGLVAGISAAGMTSGLAALGAGTMLTGIGVVATIPVITGLAGYGLVKGIKKLCKVNKLSCRERDGKWEITKEPDKEN